MELPGEKLVIKLWETIAEKGIGCLLKPWQIRREGRAQLDLRREELLVLAQVEKDVEEIRVGTRKLDRKKLELCLPELTGNHTQSESEQEIIPSLEFKSLAQIATQNAITDTIRREINVSKAIIFAETELANDAKEPPAENINEDWLFRWRDSASTVSSEDLQSLWGRLLAGELKSPGTFSLRTLEFLKNLSRTEATAISKLSSFVIDEIIYRGDKKLLEDEGISYSFLLSMQELGVLCGVEALQLTTNMGSIDNNKFHRTLCSNGMVLIVEHDDANKIIRLHACQVTAIGQQIIRLGTFPPNIGYLRRVGSAIKEQGFEVQLAKYKDIDDTQISCFEEERI